MPNNELTLRFLAQPGDVNFGGKVHGGIVMKWIDQGGYACATAWCKTYCVTVYVSGIQFRKPIRIGHLVEIRSQIIYTGNTSMHVAVDVYARDPRDEEYEKTTHCIIIFVAVDEAGNPVPVTPWVPITEEDRQQEAYALRLIDLRKAVSEEMQLRLGDV